MTLDFIQLINTFGSCLHTSIGPPEQVNLFLYSTPLEYKLTDSWVCSCKFLKSPLLVRQRCRFGLLYWNTEVFIFFHRCCTQYVQNHSSSSFDVSLLLFTSLLFISIRVYKANIDKCRIYEGESISNQPNLFPVEIHLFFFNVIAL